MPISRRTALVAGVSLPFLNLASTLRAESHAARAPAALPTHQDFTLGDFKVTTILAGSRMVENPHQIFGLNASDEDFAAAADAALIPADAARFFFTPTVVSTGSEVILFDTGTDAGGLTAALAAAGYTPEAITHVVLTHMHGDHIGGLADDAGNVTFANAQYVTGQAEYDHWAAAGNEGFDAKVKPLADKMTFLADGNEVRSGITAVLAPGHTPGHMGYMLESGGKQLMVMADTTNHYVFSLQNPDWEVSFDADKAQAAATRRKVLDMAAADKFAVIGYHMPFPGLGYVETRGEGGYHFVPHSYQLF